MFQFEKLLKENEIDENSNELPKSIRLEIKKFRAIEQSLENANSPEEISEINQKLKEADKSVIEEIKNHYEMIDEEEEKRKADEIEQQRQKEAKEQKEKEELEAKQKAEAEEKAKQEAEKQKKAEEEKNKENAMSHNEKVIFNLLKEGITEASLSELQKRGFKQGLWGVLSKTGGKVGPYKLSKSFLEEKYKISQ